MAIVFKLPVVLMGCLICLLASCTPAAESATQETMPPEMPDDFYVAVREKGGSEPTDNVFYLSADSASREAYYYDFRTLNTYRPLRSDVEAVYQALRALKPWEIGVRTDEINRVYERGGVLFEIGMQSRRIDRSNADNSHVLEGSLAAFQSVASTVRDEILAKLRPQLQPVQIALNRKGDVTLAKVDITANDFPLLKWEGSGTGEAPPPMGKNAVLPGNYHIFVHLRTEQGPLSIQDSISVSDRGRELELEIYDGSVELKKLN